MGVPPARYAQWKAVLHAGNSKPALDTVTLNYLPKNVAPEIEDVSVEMGMRYQDVYKRQPETSGSRYKRRRSLGRDFASGCDIARCDIAEFV